MLTTDDVSRIQLEIMLGLPRGDPDSRVPQTAEAREAWDAIAAGVAEVVAAGVAEVVAAGMIPELPHEVPDLDT